MNDLSSRLLLVFSTISLFTVGSCKALESKELEPIDTTAVEQAIQSAANERRSHSKYSFYDLNSPLSKYTDRLGDISNALNRGDENVESKAFAQYLQALWDNDPLVLPKEYWPEVNNPLVKIEIARLLGQAHHHCLIKADIAELRDYVRSNLQSDNKLVRLDAIFGLTSVGNLEDVETLSKIVQQEESDFAHKALSSLGSIGYLKAIDELKKLEIIVKKDSLKKSVRFYLSSYGPGFRGFYYKCGDNTGRNKDNLN